MEWMTATGLPRGVISGFYSQEKNLGQPFSRAETDLPYDEYL
jgi:hypothetical protein